VTSFFSRLFFATSAFAVASANAAEPAERLVYSAAAGCPGNAEFIAAVRARGGSIDPESSAGSGEIDVAIERTGDAYRGTVQVRSGERSSVAREIRSQRCSEVADGLAIVTALASQGEDIADAPHAAAAGAGAENTPPQTTPAAVATPERTPRDLSRLHTVGQFGAATLAVERGQIAIKNDVALTLAGGALFGIVPSTVVPRFDFTFARTNYITTPDGSGHIIGGILRGRWTFLGPTDYRVSDASTHFVGFKAGFGGCSQLVYDLEGFVVLACGEIAAGVAKQTTKDATGKVTKDELVGLGTVSLELDARYNVSRLFHLGLTAGGEGWLTQLRANRPDGREFFHTNPFGAYAVAGIGMHFW
jgi:hypothetical protein